MADITTDAAREALKEVKDPGGGKKLTEARLLKDVAAEGDRVIVRLESPAAGYLYKDEIQASVIAALQTAGVAGPKIDVQWTLNVVGRAVRPDQPRVPGVKNIIAVAAGKGGVGKSTVASNLALALQKLGARVGLFDADVYGPSLPTMLGQAEIAASTTAGQKIIPAIHFGLKVMSVGFFVERQGAVVWRGPMVHKLLQQFLEDVDWGDLDYLVMDLPPGTGDVAISLAQMLPNADMLVVTTPQLAAQRVALRAGQVTAQTGMRVAGVIENMSYFIAPDTGTRYHIFGEGGGQLLATELDTQLLGSIPLDERLREGADEGVPLVLRDPDAPASQVLRDIATQVAKRKTSMVGRSLPLMG